MAFPSDMDDPYERPEYLDNHMQEMQDHGEEACRRANEKAIEIADAMESF